MNNAEIIRLDTPEGEKHYRRLSARLPDFLEKYSPEKGYRVVKRCADSLSYEKGKLQLYEAQIRVGKKPADVGLPPILETPRMIFEAALIAADGEIIANGTACQEIKEFKDWEKGETAAFQRLLASLGFGGEVFDDDENRGLQAQGIAIIENGNGDGRGEAAATRADVAATAAAPAKTPAAEAPASGTAPETATESQKDKGVVPLPARKRGVVPAGTMSQINRLAKLKKVTVPDFKTMQEGLDFLVKLQSMPTETATG
jgi:hypothetical protein